MSKPKKSKKSKKKDNHRKVTLDVQGGLITYDIDTDEGLSDLLRLFLAVFHDLHTDVARIRDNTSALG